jgi:hypothetical protein
MQTWRLKQQFGALFPSDIQTTVSSVKNSLQSNFPAKMMA